MNLAERTFHRNDSKVTSPYGERIHPVTKVRSFHYGEDYGTHLEHWNIFALERGKVVASNYDDRNGHYIWVDYPRLKLKAFYCHLQARSVLKGQWVDENTILGQVGNTGGLINGIQYKLGIHLHMGVKLNGSYFDHAFYDYQELVKNADDLKSIDQEILKKGDLVKVVGQFWATGTKIPLWVKLKKYEIVKLNEKSALLKGINSWARLQDLKKV